MAHPRLNDAYRLMLESRAIDDECVRLNEQGIAIPNYHGARGQEALYAGVGVALHEEDYLLYNYRAFATLRAKGVSVIELANDLLMRSQGTTRGHGGIMHVTSPEKGIVGRNGVFGSKFGIALGLAQEIVLHRRRAAVICMFGEAEGNRGGLYEGVNVAILRQLPIVFVAENNGYAVAATTSDLYASGDMSSHWRGFPMPVTKIDGNDVDGVASELSALGDRARAGLGPAFVECVTFRLDPHHLHDDDTRYRDAALLAARWSDEPIARVERLLVEHGATERQLERIRAEVRDSVRNAFEKAQASPRAAVNGVLDQVFWKSDGRGEVL